MASILIVNPLWQCAEVNFQLGHFIRLVHWLKRGADTPFLTTGLFIAFPLLAGLLSVWVGGRRLAAVLAVKGYAVE